VSSLRRNFRKKFVRPPRRPKSIKQPKFQGPELSANDLHRFSQQVRERDDFTCQICGSKKETQAHHILSKFYHPEFALDSTQGITLCKKCHIGRRGVHGSSFARNEWVEKLRGFFRSKNITAARLLIKQIKEWRLNEKSREKRNNNRARDENLPVLPKAASIRKSSKRRLHVQSIETNGRTPIRRSVKRIQ